MIVMIIARVIIFNEHSHVLVNIEKALEAYHKMSALLQAALRVMRVIVHQGQQIYLLLVCQRPSLPPKLQGITPVAVASSSSATHDHVPETLLESDVPQSPSSPSHDHVPETVLVSDMSHSGSVASGSTTTLDHELESGSDTSTDSDWAGGPAIPYYNVDEYEDEPGANKWYTPPLKRRKH